MLDRRAFFSSFGLLGVVQPPTRHILTDVCTACKTGRYKYFRPVVTWKFAGPNERFQVPEISKTDIEQRCTDCGDLRAIPKPSERLA
jgi:hypothetical protein